jgi:hypothetical protein
VLKKRIVSLTLAGLWLGVVPGTADDGRSCPELQAAKPQAHLEYLQRDRATLTPACIAYATDQLGLHQHSPAVKTLAVTPTFPHFPLKTNALPSNHPFSPFYNETGMKLSTIPPPPPSGAPNQKIPNEPTIPPNSNQTNPLTTSAHEAACAPRRPLLSSS